MGFEEPSEYYQSPEANLLRRQLEAEKARQRRDAQVADDLLASLRPDDAQLSLFSFEEIRVWGLKHTRKRARE